MPFAWFVALRYLRTDKGQTALILAAISIGASVIVFLSALIDGLQASLVEQTLGTQPHVTLRLPREAARPLVQATPALAIARTVQTASQRLRSIDQWPAAEAAAEGVAGVTAVSPVVSGAGFAIHGDTKEPVLVRGIDPESSRAIVDVPQKLVEGRFEVGGGEALMGSKLAANLGVRVGDKIRLQTSEGTEDTLPVTGIFNLGNEAVDRAWLLTSLPHAQALYGLPGGVTSLEVKVARVFEADRVATELADRTGLEADSWMKLNAELLQGLSAQSSSRSIIEFFVAVAVALGIASVLAVSVVQKSREIGILRANGTPARRVLAVFLIQGGVLAMLGSLAGSALGALFSKLFERVALTATGEPRFPVKLAPTLFLATVLLAVVVGLLAALLPAVRAARLDPAAAIRHG